MTHHKEIRVAWRQYRKLLRRATRYTTWHNYTWVGDLMSSAQKIKEQALALERLDEDKEG